MNTLTPKQQIILSFLSTHGNIGRLEASYFKMILDRSIEHAEVFLDNTKEGDVTDVTKY